MSAPLALPDRADRAADAGMWLFTASLVMLMASLVSGYVLLRAGSAAWPTPWVRGGAGALDDPWFRLLCLLVAAGACRRGGPWMAARHIARSRVIRCQPRPSPAPCSAAGRSRRRRCSSEPGTARPRTSLRRRGSR